MQEILEILGEGVWAAILLRLSPQAHDMGLAANLLRLSPQAQEREAGHNSRGIRIARASSGEAAVDYSRG